MGDREDFQADLSQRAWGQGLLPRLDGACIHDAFFRFSGLRVEMPSRRWLQEAMDSPNCGLRPGAPGAGCGFIASPVQAPGEGMHD